MSKYLLLSIKQQYTDLIFDGSKDIELRKSKPNVSVGDHVIIYCTSPIKAIVGVARVKDLIIHSPERMWRLHSRRLGITRTEYFNYYSGFERAVGIVLEDVEKLNSSICLDIIKEHLPTFTPPQTFKYFLRFNPPGTSQKSRLVLS